MKRIILAGLALGLVAAGLVLLRDRSVPQNTSAEYPVTGVVLAFENDDAILVAHQEIAGFMPAMTMPFVLDDPSDRQRLSPGDVVQFTFRVGAERSRATDVRVTGRQPAALAAYAATTARNSARLRTGDALPAFSLVDQDGRPLSEADLRGRPTLLTFIFTRCPVPEFCPLITGRFREVQRELVADAALADVRLLSITLDPLYDTPEVLREYGRAMGADFTRWRFATGTPDQVAVLTRAFAVYTQASGGTIDHTLATALIDPNGQVAELWRGQSWKTQDVLDAIRRVGAQ